MDTTTLQALGALLAEKGLLTSTTCLPAQPLAVCGADCDSRVVEPGHVFVCKGARFDPAYLTSALEAGAVGYLGSDIHMLGPGYREWEVCRRLLLRRKLAQEG